MIKSKKKKRIGIVVQYYLIAREKRNAFINFSAELASESPLWKFIQYGKFLKSFKTSFVELKTFKEKLGLSFVRRRVKWLFELVLNPPPPRAFLYAMMFNPHR